MARPKSNKERKDVRVNMFMAQSEMDAIDDWMFARRLRSRSEAIRRLIILGLRSSKDIGDVKLQNELEAELEKRVAEQPTECPSFLWGTILAERGIEA